MKMKALLTVLVVAVLVLGTAVLRGRQPSHASVHAPLGDRQRVAALNDALKNGLVTEDEYDKKIDALADETADSTWTSARDVSDALPHETAAPSATASPVPSSRRKEVQLIDPAFQMVAYTFTIPEDWKFEGTVLRGEGCNTSAPSVVYRITSPDGLSGIQGMPTFNWFYGQNDAVLRQVRAAHCKVMLPMNSKDFAHYILPLVRPDAKAGEVQPAPNAAQWNAMIEQQNQGSQHPGYGAPAGRVMGDSVQVHVDYKFKNTPMEEWFVVNTQIIENSLPAGIGTAPQKYDNSTAYVWTRRAPQGKLEALDQLLREINGSATPNPEWNNRQMSMVRERQNADNARVMKSIHDTGERTAQLLKSNHEQYMAESTAKFNSVMQQDRDKMSAMDRSAAAYTLYAGDEQLMRNPATGEVGRVSSKYNNAWQEQNGGGTLLSNANFDPNTYLRGTWTQLEPVNPLAQP